MKVNLTKAAELVGLSRPYFYMQYVKAGKVSTEKDGRGKPVVDTSELLRVFGKLTQITNDAEQKQTEENSDKTTVLEAELVAAREQIAELRKDKVWLQGKVDELTNVVKQIEHKPAVVPEPVPAQKWWNKKLW